MVVKKINKNKKKDSRNKLIIILGIIIFTLILTSIILAINYFENNLQTISSSVEVSAFSSNYDRFTLNPVIRNSSEIINIQLIAEEKKIMYSNGKQFDSYTYNGLSPGPIIRGRVGDILNITIINKLREDTTIHWHGIDVPNNMDGVPDITQVPIKPDEIFTYFFELKEEGTYWYHPHYSTSEQIGRGLYGVIIVEPEEENVKFDAEEILILDDIRFDNNYQIAPFYETGMDQNMAGRYGNSYFINGKESFDIKAYKEGILRLRLLNTANARLFNFAIEDHKFLVIGKDQSKISKPYFTDSLVMAPGDRIDILIYLDNTKKSKFNLLNGEDIIGTLNYNLDSKIYNNSNYLDELSTQILNSNILNLDSIRLNKNPDIIYELDKTALGCHSPDTKWVINQKFYPGDLDIQELKEGEFYKIRYINKQNMYHPMHLHGQKFVILNRSIEKVENLAYEDTVLIAPGEIVDIGLIAKGKGDWVHHCHILEHAQAGMLSLVKVK